MRYNTQNTRLVLPEYGRYIHEMVSYALTLDEHSERQRCAEGIIALMATKAPQQKVTDDFKAKLWNQLAYMANYALEVDFPYPIVKRKPSQKGLLTYPKDNIKGKQYGRWVEQLIGVLPTIKDEQEQATLIDLLVFQMRKSLAEWNPDTLSDEKIADDIAKLSQGQIQLDPNAFKPSQVSYTKLKQNNILYKQRKGRKGQV